MIRWDWKSAQKALPSSYRHAEPRPAAVYAQETHTYRAVLAPGDLYPASAPGDGEEKQRLRSGL